MLGVGTHTIKLRNNTPEALAEYSKNLTEIKGVSTFLLPALTNYSPSFFYLRKLKIWPGGERPMSSGCSNPQSTRRISTLRGTSLVFDNFKDSSYKVAIYFRRAITPEALDKYNEVSSKILGSSPQITMWTSVQSLVEEYLAEMKDGLHFPPMALKQAEMVRRAPHWPEF